MYAQHGRTELMHTHDSRVDGTQLSPQMTHGDTYAIVYVAVADTGTRLCLAISIYVRRSGLRVLPCYVFCPHESVLCSNCGSPPTHTWSSVSLFIVVSCGSPSLSIWSSLSSPAIYAWDIFGYFWSHGPSLHMVAQDGFLGHSV